MLVHICRRWRRIVFESQRTLHLRIFCTCRTPVLKTLHCWPMIPIDVQYGGSLELGHPAPKDEGNIMASLKQSSRVSSINLTATQSLLDKLSAIEKPFSELEDLVLLSRDGVLLTLPTAFRWGPRLRCFHSTRVAIPGLLQLLYFSTNLVDLQLHEVLDFWQFPPEVLTDALSGMTQLQSLSLHFLSTTNYRVLHPQSWGCAVLPVLTRFNFRGTAEYLEGLVVRIDAPRLGDIEVTFFDALTVDLSILSEFIDQIEIQKSHRRAHILSSEHSISISLIQPGASTCLKLQLLREPLSDQLSSMAQICTSFSALLSNVEDLRISVTRPSSGQDNSNHEKWLMRMIRQFKYARWLCVAGVPSTNTVFSLPLSVLGRATLLPALNRPCITEPAPHYARAPLLDAVASVTNSLRLSGGIIGVEYDKPGTNELRGTGTTFLQC
ncbi:hypothetical protein EDB87DRAFT_680631 [Lactarius vividus]|nr:hypothetical protein EDB87DRAFT_680631 [Lactarius vividus]